jgi:hypothetical protein
MGKTLQSQILNNRSGRICGMALAPFLLLSLAAAAPEYTPAPVPQQNISAPALDQSDDQTPKVSPRLFSAVYTGSFQGDGYPPGSTNARTEQERWVGATPGVSISVPLQ